MSEARGSGFVYVRPRRVADVVAGSPPPKRLAIRGYVTWSNIDEVRLGISDTQRVATLVQDLNLVSTAYHECIHDAGFEHL